MKLDLPEVLGTLIGGAILLAVVYFFLVVSFAVDTTDEPTSEEQYLEQLQ